MKTYTSVTDPAVVSALQSGAVAVLPTDTVYGLVCQAAAPAAVARLYSLKHREHKPGTIIAANVAQLVELGLKARYMKPIEQYWPGALSVVIPTASLAYLHQGKQSLAVRIPNHPELQKLLAQTGPLLTSSANLPGEPVANTMAEAEKYFGEAVDLYVDGGSLEDHLPSTIIRIVDDAIEVLRDGAVKLSPPTE